MVHFSNRRSTIGSRAQRRADARRVEILRAAAHVFRDRGFAAAGMRDIAVAADLSPANLYHYFRGKDEILFFCQDRALDRLNAALADARRAAAPAARRLHQLARAHVLCLVGEVEGAAAHLEIDALPPKRRAAIVAKRDRYERGVRALVEAGIRAGTLRHDDAVVATRAFLGALNWTARWFRPEGAHSPERLADLVADYAVAGLGGARLKPSAARLKPSPYPSTQERNDETAGAHRAHRQRRTDRGRVRAVQNAARGPA